MARKKRVRGVAETPRTMYGSARLLLDTHVWLWWHTSDKRLGPLSRARIANAPDVWLSVGSAWEIAIKSSLGKLPLPPTFDIGNELAEDEFTLLPIALNHLRRVRDLRPIHRDPFDRLLIAQALEEGLTLMTADPRFARYDVPVVSPSA